MFRPFSRGEKEERFTAKINFQRVEYIPPPFLQKPKLDTIFEGFNITLECQLPVEPRCDATRAFFE